MGKWCNSFGVTLQFLSQMWKAESWYTFYETNNVLLNGTSYNISLSKDFHFQLTKSPCAERLRRVVDRGFMDEGSLGFGRQNFTLLLVHANVWIVA